MADHNRRESELEALRLNIPADQHFVLYDCAGVVECPCLRIESDKTRTIVADAKWRRWEAS